MNPTGRFSGRASAYARYRPSYPDEILAALQGAGLPAGANVADLGAGTGISSEFFLRHGCRVAAVEPNADMRSAAMEWLGRREGFRVVSGTAEQSGLPSGEFDLAVAFQAAHWFDFNLAVAEMRRLIRPGGLLAMAWNLRSKELSEFDRALERLLQDRAFDYARYEERRLESISGLAEFKLLVFRHEQTLDWDSLRGLAQSWSYVPPPGHERHNAFFAELQRLFEANSVEGVIRLRYDCHLYFGR